MEKVFIIEARFREDWKVYLMSLNDGNAAHFAHADINWHPVGGCDAYLSLHRALGEAQQFACDQFDVRIVDFLSDEPVKLLRGKVAPEIESPEWIQAKEEVEAWTT